MRLRPIAPKDAPKLVELHDRLSSETQYLRFFGPKPHLSEAEAVYLADVDFVRRFAIVGELIGDDASQLVAVGRFDVRPDGTAEPAIVVRDDFQSAGLGTAILERLVEVARGRAVDAFIGEILAENTKMIELLRSNGLIVSAPADGVVTIKAPIGDVPLILRGLDIVTDVATTLRPKIPRRRKDDGGS